MKTFAHFLRTLCTHIPIFTSQLEKAKEGTDAANIRSAYAEVMTSALTGDVPASGSTNENDVTYNSGSWSKTVELTQGKDGWQDTTINDSLLKLVGNVQGNLTGTPGSGKTATVSYNESSKTTTIAFN